MTPNTITAPCPRAKSNSAQTRRWASCKCPHGCNRSLQVLQLCKAICRIGAARPQMRPELPLLAQLPLGARQSSSSCSTSSGPCHSSQHGGRPVNPFYAKGRLLSSDWEGQSAVPSHKMPRNVTRTHCQRGEASSCDPDVTSHFPIQSGQVSVFASVNKQLCSAGMQRHLSLLPHGAGSRLPAPCTRMGNAIQKAPSYTAHAYIHSK